MPRPKRTPGLVRLADEDYSEAESEAIKALLGSLQYDKDEIIRPLDDPEAVREEAIELASDFKKFIPAAWHLVEPATYVGNWHIDMIAEVLMAVSAGDLTDVLITMPPRHSKSLIITVLWPVWEWINLPSYRWVFASYAFNLSVRDSIKRRKIINSAWFKARFGHKFHLIDEQNSKVRYENDKHGFMLASSVGGSNTGEGGERIVADDPHNIKKIESEEVRQDTVDWWNIVMSTRRNVSTETATAKKSARVVVQQRTHEGDVAGDIIERGGYTHINLPTEFGFAGAPRCVITWTRKSDGKEMRVEDPRTEVGELLNPLRFDAEANEKAKIDLGDYQYAAQHGQNPTPPSGQIFQKAWLKYYGNSAKGQPPVPDWSKSTHPFSPIFTLDATFKEHKDTDFVAGLAWCVFGADIYLMPMCIHKRMNFPNTVDAIAEFVGGESMDGKKFPGIYPFIKIKLVEDKANGTAIVDTLKHRIPGMMPWSPGNASKPSRAQAVSWRFRAGNIYLPDASICPWIKEYEYELCAFPKAKKDDYVDATSMALLFIGGDQKIQGEPIVQMQAGGSRWHHISSEDLDSTESVWGSVGGTGRSIWQIR